MKAGRKSDPSRSEHGCYYDQGFRRVTVRLLTSTFEKGLSHCMSRNVIVTRIPNGAKDEVIAEQLSAVPHGRLATGSLTWLELQGEIGLMVSTSMPSGVSG